MNYLLPLSLTFGGDIHTVMSLDEAASKWNEYRRAHLGDDSTRDGSAINDAQGFKVAHITYRGEVWPILKTDAERIEALRRALGRLLDATGRVSTNAAMEARDLAHAAWVETQPDELKAAVLALARSRNPAIRDYLEAIHAQGTCLLDEVSAAMTGARA